MKVVVKYRCEEQAMVAEGSYGAAIAPGPDDAGVMVNTAGTPRDLLNMIAAFLDAVSRHEGMDGPTRALVQAWLDGEISDGRIIQTLAERYFEPEDVG